MKTVKLFDQNARQDSTVQPSAVRDDTPARQFHARLVMTDGRRYCALTGEGAIWVVPAAGCLLQPAVGDIALVSVSGPDGTSWPYSNVHSRIARRWFPCRERCGWKQARWTSWRVKEWISMPAPS